MENLEWSWFETWDDSVLIQVNLTEREMALLRSAISFIENPDVWSESSDYEIDVYPAIELINFTISDSQ